MTQQAPDTVRSVPSQPGVGVASVNTTMKASLDWKQIGAILAAVLTTFGGGAAIGDQRASAVETRLISVESKLAQVEVKLELLIQQRLSP